MPDAAVLETALYAPVKVFLEGQGYAVKAEVEGCDVVAVRGDEPPVIVELKTRFSLDLVLQATDRQRLSGQVYVAVPLGPPRSTMRARKARRITQPIAWPKAPKGMAVKNPWRVSIWNRRPRKSPARLTRRTRASA